MNESGDEIVVEAVFPNRPATVWRALTSGPLIGRWLGMTPVGFEPLAGTRFTYQTTPGGAWDGVIHCEVLEVVVNERLVYSWRSGHAANAGYGAPLDTRVLMTLRPDDGGTALRIVHSGFHRPRNDTAYESMSEGWSKCAKKIGDVADE